MKRLVLLLMLLCIPLAHGETPPVMLLPQGHICFGSEPVGQTPSITCWFWRSLRKIWSS